MNRTSLRELMLLAAGSGGGGSGARFIKGTFTVPDNGDTYEFNFGDTFDSYLFLVEMTSESKAALINAGQTAGRTFAFIGVFPKRNVNNIEPANVVLIQRYNPSAATADGGTISTVEMSNSSIKFPLSGLNSANYMYRGFSYNYYIVEVK